MGARSGLVRPVFGIGFNRWEHGPGEARAAAACHTRSGRGSDHRLGGLGSPPGTRGRRQAREMGIFFDKCGVQRHLVTQAE